MIDFIRKIKINKIKHLRNLEIDIADEEKKHLIITGKNGSGKTTILEEVRKYLQVIQDGKMLNLISSWPMVLEKSYERYKQLLDNNNNTLEQQASIERVQNDIKVFEDAIRKYSDGLQVEFNDGSKIVEKYTKGEYILAYFKATRNLKIDIPTNVPKIQLKEKYDIEENVGSIFLNYMVYLKTQQSFAKNENEFEEADRIQIWFDKFENAIRGLMEDESIYLKFDYRNLNFTINQNEREPYGFNMLSDGYSAVLDIVINLILRMEKHNKPIYDIEGIVIIDELENHLHIGLQKNILPFLIELFPNIQFIISTHSPFIINSIDNVVIYDLEKKQRVEDLSGLGYEGIVEGYFDINQYSDNVKRKLKRYDILVNNLDKNEDEEEEEYELRGYLKGISAELSPEVVLEFNNIEITRKSNK